MDLRYVVIILLLMAVALMQLIIWSFSGQRLVARQQHTMEMLAAAVREFALQFGRVPYHGNQLVHFLAGHPSYRQLALELISAWEQGDDGASQELRFGPAYANRYSFLTRGAHFFIYRHDEMGEIVESLPGEAQVREHDQARTAYWSRWSPNRPFRRHWRQRQASKEDRCWRSWSCCLYFSS